ncbi:MAG: GNAT family N-acetyltransferase [Simkaniaceae bacterium]|nr:GNAT family N-acetyltransferase [Simkaniaceae bacterium]MCF7851650.1 GNAT family N-acetyltransferase [Simkaniaceae bacterium]
MSIEDKVQMRLSENDDLPFLISFLMQPGVLPYFPMCDHREVEDAARITISYRDVGSVYTAEYEGKICGFVILYVSPFSKLKHQSLFMIIVSEKFRNLGIGSYMLDYLEKVAKEDHQIEMIHLEVYEDNPARRLYSRKGYVEYGRHPKFLKESDGYRDKILMQKKLGEYGRT